MGKLYDRKDLDYDLAVIDELESRISKHIVAGTMDPTQLGFIDGLTTTQRNKDGKLVTKTKIQGEFDRTRAACRWKFLQTMNLMRDLEAAKRSGDERRVNIIRKRIKDAGDENLARRAAEGQLRPEDLLERGQVAVEQHEYLNKWELWYTKDKREGLWPAERSAGGSYDPEGLAYNKEMFGSLDYRGWLNMVHYHGEMTDKEWSEELNRLREANS